MPTLCDSESSEKIIYHFSIPFFNKIRVGFDAQLFKSLTFLVLCNILVDHGRVDAAMPKESLDFENIQPLLPPLVRSRMSQLVGR